MLVQSLPASRPEQLSDKNLSEDKHSIEFLLHDAEQKPVDYFYIIENKRFVKIRYADIKCIEANRCYLMIQTHRTQHLVTGSLVQLEKRLPSSVFCRVHRAWIVPVDGISEIGKQRICVNGDWYPLGLTYRKRLVEHIRSHVFNRSYLEDFE